MKKLINKKIFHITVLLCIILVIFLAFAFITVRYYVEGETNMPFNLSKISVISSSEGFDNPELVEGNKWHFNINQNNDVYLYIDKNEQYDKTETIDEILINNIKMSKQSEKGSLKVYKPDISKPDVLFYNSDENSIDQITYMSAEVADMKNLKITNQGGILVLRFANNNVAECISNDEEINHNDLLKKSSVSLDDLKFNTQFDLSIKLSSKKSFVSTISLDFPLDSVIDNGTSSKEFTDTHNFIFKRIVD